MGLIGWIKNKYYDSRLKKADEFVQKKQFVEAEEIYRKLFGKQPMAVVHLANRYVLYSEGVDEKLSSLRSIEELREYTNEENLSLYEKELNSHVENIYVLSISKFSEKKYSDAVKLIDAIKPYKTNDNSYAEKLHQHHAYLSFSNLIQTSKYDLYLNEIVSELKQYHSNRISDIDHFVDALFNKSFYGRAIKLLDVFISEDGRYKNKEVECVINIVCGKDKDIVSPNKISDFCPNNELRKEASKRLFQLAVESANRNDYTTSLLYDKFASEFLDDDNSFCLAWCNHIFRELEQRANANEIKALISKAKTLKLTEQQTNGLIQDVAKLAQNTTPEKGVEICRLFLKDKTFDQIYISQSESIAKNCNTKLNKNELLSVVKANTNDDSYVDVLARFVPYVPDFVPLFVNAAIQKILRHKSTNYLEQYWAIKEDPSFFKELITTKSNIKEAVVNCIVENDIRFLHSSNLLQSFLNAIDTLKDDEYSYIVAKRLYSKRQEVLDYFIKVALLRCDKLNADECIAMIDHTLDVIQYQTQRRSVWIPLYLRKRKLQTKDDFTLSQKTLFYKETIDTIINTSVDISEIDEPEYYSLWQDYTEFILKKASSQPKETAIKVMMDVRGLVANYCKSFATYTTLCDNLSQRIAKYRWEIGNEQEEDREYDKAIISYKATIDEKIPTYLKKAEFRYLICKIKDGQVTDELEENIEHVLQQKSYQILHDDLAYRYICFLIKTVQPEKAEKVIQNYLPIETQLLEICKNLYIKESEKYLIEFNEKFSQLADNKLTLQEALNFYKEFSHYKTVISRNLTDTTNKFVTYRRKLESYIIKSYFEEEQYASAFEKLQILFPNFFEDDTNYRNVAIAALGTVEMQQTVSEDLYKKAISIWLSAVYCDRLFVKSLDYTTWDDPFTFTLQGSLGNSIEEEYEELPANVNFEEPVDNQNIAILSVQNSLISRMEMFIRDNRPEMEDFFKKEKDALDDLIELRLDESCVIAAPYFAKKNRKVLESVKDAFDVELSQGYDNKEDVLALGVNYGFLDGQYGEYKEAFDYAEQCKNAASKSTKSLRSQLLNLPQIRAYDKLYASVKSFFSSMMNESIHANMNYKDFIDKYEPVCVAFNDTAMSMAFSQYANGEVVHLLNDDLMQLGEGVGYMVRIFNVSPSSIQVKKNLEGMLCNMAVSCAVSPNSTDERIINDALQRTGSTFKNAVAEARIQGLLSDIVNKVKNKKMTLQQALEKVYQMYISNPNNDRICSDLVALCDVCINNYIIGQEVGSTNVRKTLDALNRKKSVTFKRHAKTLAEKYSEIWESIPYENKLVLKGISIGSTLNDKGRALRDGLLYYKNLGGYQSRPGFVSLDL